MAEYVMAPKERSIDEAIKLMDKRCRELGIPTIFDRFERQLPQCGYGLLGLCCRLCLMGPCKIDPFGIGPTRTVCGANADNIIARNLLVMIATGCSAHAEHGYEIAHVLYLVGTKGENFPYKVTDEAKLRAIAKKLGIPDAETKPVTELAKEVAEKALEDFGRFHSSETLNFLKAYVTRTRYEVFEKLGILPRAIWREITEAMHRVHVGVDADPVNILTHGLRTALADCYAKLIATELQDVLFGTPKPVETEANLGVLKEDHVNIVVHGHNPLLSMKVVEVARSEEMLKLAQEMGAKGINVVGVCCTGNEVLMRLGIPPAGNMIHQEFVLATGAVEAMVVDYQCVIPGIIDVARCFHTKVITTMPVMKIPGAIHIEWSPERADEVAKEIVRIAVENYRYRVKEKVYIPPIKTRCMAGFSVEAILEALGGTLEPLISAIKTGDIYGVVGMVGCNNPKVTHDMSHVTIAKELLAHNILLVHTGCSALAMAKAGLMSLEGIKYAGDGLRKILEKLRLPPCLHMGSCVDNSRILNLLNAVAEALKVDIPDLPVAGSAPEAMSPKAVAIGTWFVTQGVTVHVGTVPPVLGSERVTKLLTEDLERITGGRFIVEPDPKEAAEIIIDVIRRKRARLGLPT